MFDRLRRPFPADSRLEATRETEQRWDRLVRSERAISTLRTTVETTATAASAAAKLGARAAAKVVGIERSNDDPDPQVEEIPASVRDRDLPERQATRSPHEWSGSAALVIGPTSSGFQVGQPLHRRRLRSDLITGWPDGWLRVSPVELLWHPTDRRSSPSTTMRVVRLGAADIADLELVDLGRRRAGLTVTATDGNELWLYVEDRKKLDEMASRLRYGDRP